MQKFKSAPTTPKNGGAESPRATRRNGRIIFVPRPVVPLSARKRTKDAAFAALQVPPAERTDWQVESIECVLSQWPCFCRVLPKVSTRREICKCLIFEFCKPNTLLFKVGDISDGWYVMYSGECVLYRQCEGEGERGEMDVMLQRQSYDERYEPFRTVGEHEDFGSEELRKDRPRTYAAVVTQPSYVIHVDSALYRMCVEWVERTELQTRTRYLMDIEELSPLLIDQNLFERLAEVMEEDVLLKGVEYNSICGGWVIVQSGAVARKRVADFTKVEVHPSLLEVADVKIVLPEGRVRIVTDVYGPNRMFCDPSLSTSLHKPFSIDVLEDTKVWTIRHEHVRDLLPIDVRREVEQPLLDDATDDELVRLWVANEREVQWEFYRQKCNKQARRFMKQMSRDMNGDFSCRRPKPPKAIKGIESPRRRYKKLSETLLT